MAKIEITMSIVSIHQAKSQLSKLIQLALAGEEVIIANRNEPVVRLQVIKPDKPRIQYGGLKHLVVEMGNSFDQPLDDFDAYSPSMLLDKVAEEPGNYRAGK